MARFAASWWGLLVGASVLLMSGCGDVGPGSDAIDVARTATLKENKWGCKTCGFSNSPRVGASGSFVLGEAQADTPALTAAVDPAGKRYSVDIVDQSLVIGSRLGARSSNEGVTGDDLVGWSLVMRDAAGAESHLEIAAYDEVADWVSGHPIATYALLTKDAETGETRGVCGSTPNETAVTLVYGERYDAQTKTIERVDNFGAFACKGQALAKMKLMGRAPNDGYGSTWQDRQATLKMLTADYCGTGESFTRVGEPLAWVDALGWFSEVPDLATKEAHWTDAGAQCLDTPRWASRADVLDQCALPTCDDEADNAAWVSYLPGGLGE